MLSGLLVMREYISVSDGLLYAVIGLIFVFIGIALLIGVVSLVGLFMQKTNGKMSSFKKEKAEPKATPAPAVATVTETEEVPDQVKAAIVAAIMAYYNAEKPQCEFVVKKIKRI